MIDNNLAQKALAAFYLRLRGLELKGYSARFIAENKPILFCKLIDNKAKEAILTLNIENGIIEQYSNKRKIYSGKVCES